MRSHLFREYLRENESLRKTILACLLGAQVCLINENQKKRPAGRVADLHHLDPDPGSDKNVLRIRLRIRIQAKTVSVPGKSKNFDNKSYLPCIMCLNY